GTHTDPRAATGAATAGPVTTSAAAAVGPAVGRAAAAGRATAERRRRGRRLERAPAGDGRGQGSRQGRLHGAGGSKWPDAHGAREDGPDGDRRRARPPGSARRGALRGDP